MSGETQERKRWGVPCLHCGDLIPLAAHGAVAATARVTSSAYVVVWCGACHKEAPYLSREIVELDGIPPEANPPVRPGPAPRSHGLVMRRGQAA